MKIVVHDGHKNIGGNKISVCSKNGECFLLDFGFNFSKWGEYFEEFLSPRAGRILEDLIKLDLIPIIPAYREDISTAGLSHDGRYKFVFYSHAHADHIGMAGLLSKDIPALTTTETLAIALVDSEMGKSDVWSTLTGKERVKCDKPALRKDLRCSGKNKIVRRVALHQLEYNKIIDKRFEYVNMKDLWDELKIFKVYHSVIGAAALAAKVDGWWVVYTGDLKLRPHEDARDWKILFGEKRMEISKKTEEFLEQAKNLHPMILIVEGTTVVRENPKTTSEMDVFENAVDVVKKTKGLVLVDFPRRHIERLLTFLKVAFETDRYFVLMPKNYAYLLKIEEMEPTWKLTEEERSKILVYHPGSLSFRGEEKNAVEKAIKEGILIEYNEIEKDPSKYILTSGYWYITSLLDFDEKVLKDAVYIHSTSEAYTEEQQIDVKRFGNWLERFGIKSYGIKFTGDAPEFTGRFHSSGHAMPHEIEKIVNSLVPEIIIPVHTLNPDWFAKRWEDKVITTNTLQI